MQFICVCILIFYILSLCLIETLNSADVRRRGNTCLRERKIVILNFKKNNKSESI